MPDYYMDAKPTLHEVWPFIVRAQRVLGRPVAVNVEAILERGLFVFTATPAPGPTGFFQLEGGL